MMNASFAIDENASVEIADCDEDGYFVLLTTSVADLGGRVIRYGQYVDDHDGAIALKDKLSSRLKFKMCAMCDSPLLGEEIKEHGIYCYGCGLL